MHRFFRRRWLASLLVVLALTLSAQADEITWTYETSGPSTVNADGGTSGAVTFFYNPQEAVTGSSHIVMANLWTWSEASSSTPDTFTNAPYTLSIYLKDHASGAESTLSFNGALNGTVSQQSSLLSNTFSGPMEQTVALGNNQFKVSLLGYMPPGPGGSSNAGAISALVQVTTSAVPEPTSLTLAGLGLGVAGLVSWRKRRKIGLVS